MGGEMPGSIALVLAAGVLLAPAPFAVAQSLSIDSSHGLAAIGVSNETAVDDFAQDFDPYEIFSSRPAMTLAVNGRVVATDGEPASATGYEWNWTLLLLGFAGLVMTNLPRRLGRRAVIFP